MTPMKRRLPPTLLITGAALTAALLLFLLVGLPTTALAQSATDDATLSGLTVSPRDIIGFTANRTAYEVGVASDVTQATINATASDSGAAVVYSGTDFDANTAGHQVVLSAGRNGVTITVTAADTTTTKTYRVRVNRGVIADYGWKAVDDLDGLKAAGNTDPYGLWSDGDTMWVADVVDDKIYAYNTDGTRDETRDFDTLDAAGNNSPSGIWSNGDTMWVVDGSDSKIYAYRMSNQSRASGKDFNSITLAEAGNTSPTGIWSDGETMWVADGADNKLYAYRMSNKTRDGDKDFDKLAAAGNQTPNGIWSDDTTMWVADWDDDKVYAYKKSDKTRDGGKDFSTLSAADNEKPAGLWSDDTTMWVADWDDDKVYAYKKSDKTRDGGKDFSTLSAADNEKPAGLWSDGTTMWVSDADDNKVYSYNMPPPPQSDDATLSGLAVSPRDIIGFNSERTAYEVGVASTVTQATITATASDSGAAVVYSGTDSDANTAEHQVNLSAGRNVVTITVTAEDGVTTQEYTVSVNLEVTDDYGWKAVDDLDGLKAAGNANPRSIWSDGATMWVSDVTDGKIFAYNTDGTRDETRDFDTLDAAGNNNPIGIWSNSETMWVADTVDDKIYAYKMSDQDRDSDKDFDTLDAAGNNAPRDIWSDSETMWVTDFADHKLYAYKMSDRARDDDKDFDTLAAGNTDPYGIWSDGATMWVADYTGDKLYAYRVSDQSRDGDRDLNTLDAAGNQDPRGIWSDGETMWVADIDDDKVYSYNMPTSDDATLSGLAVSPRDIIGFNSERTAYEVGVASTVTQATITATARDSGAVVAYSGTDADAADGHQVNLSAGRNVVTITVTAEDGVTTETYTVRVNQGVTADYGWKAVDDLDGLLTAGNASPIGIWSDGATIWVADDIDDKIYAYNTDGTRDSNKDFDTLDAAGNNTPRGIWSDGETMWVADIDDETIYAYRMSDKARDDDKDFDTLDPAGNDNPNGIWSDGETMWVADFTDNKIYAYNTDGTRDSDKDFDTLAAGNTRPRGIWSDGETMWVADSSDGKIYAYRVSDRARDGDRDFDTLIAAGNNAPLGIWSDGETMWVADITHDKVYSYNMPPSADATLSGLAVSPRDIIGFKRGRTSYEVGVASTVTQATINATAGNSGAAVVFSGTDADATTPGHQVALSAGANVVTVTVTATDTVTTKTYTVSVNRGVTDDYGWKAVDDLDGLKAAGNGSPRGIWSDGATVWVADSGSNIKIFAYNTDGTRDSDKDFDTLSAAGNNSPSGIWSNGETMWVADAADHKIYAYRMSDQGRDSGTDADTLAAARNDNPSGIWSDGATMWVADPIDNKIYAYRMSDQDRDSGKDFDTLDAAGNTDPIGIWSDGATMWVADATAAKIYAYNTDGTRDNTRDFDTLRAAGNGNLYGIWSDGATMWVADWSDDKVYSYNMLRPPSVVDVDAAIDLTPLEDDDRVGKYSSPGHAKGEIVAEFEVHWVRVKMFATREYRFELSGTALYAEIEGVYSAEGVKLAGPGSEVGSWRTTKNTGWFRLDETKDYYVAVAGGSNLGDWKLWAYHRPVKMPQESPEASDDLSSPARVEVGGCFVGVAVPSNPPPDLDDDWVGVELTAGTEYLIEVRAWESALGSLIDADLKDARVDPDDAGMEVYGVYSGYVLLPGWPDQGRGQEERVIWTPPVSGLYFLVIVNPGGFTGSYVLSVSPSVGGSVDCGPTMASAVARALAAPAITPTDPPARPEGLTGTVAHDAVSLTWDDPGDESITGYQILRRNRDVDAQGQFRVHVDDTGSAATSYVDRDVAPETRYGYRIMARSAGGLGERSAYFNADTPAAPDPALNRPATGLPTISGTAQVGQTLTADTSGIGDADGLVNATFSYQWSITLGAASADIPGATEVTYLPTATDEGVAIKVKVSFTDDAGNEETLTSAATEAVSFTVRQQAANSAATGAPTITGTAQVGETLTVDTSGIADADGLSGATFGYQWIANDGSADADISGATDSIYALAASDEARTIRVRVSFTDDGGNDESLTSAATAAVAAAEPQEPPAIPRNLEAAVSDDGAVTLTWDDPGDAGITGYQILRRNRDTSAMGVFEVHVEDTGSAATSYVDRDAAPETRYNYRVKARNESGLSRRSNFVRADTPSAPNSPATGAPAISGTAQVGETLTADASGIGDADGLTNVSYSYQWISSDGITDTEITGAMDSNYTLADDDEDATIRVRVSFTDDAENEETLTSAATAAVAAKPNSPATGAPTISGTARVGETLRADTSGIADADGLDNAVFSYQWRAAAADIPGATNSTYILTDADEGKAVTVRVSFTDDAGHEETLTSAATAEVAARPNSPATGLPTISGVARVGETLAADTSGIGDGDGLDNVVFGFQWSAVGGNGGEDIQGATEAAYILTEAEEGKAVRVRVSFTDDAGNGETLTSAVTASVTAAEPEQPPSKPRGLAGTVAHDEVSLTWTDPGDASITGYQILRRNRDVDAPGKFQVHVDDTGSAAASYSDRDVTPETSYVYRIKARNAGGLSKRSDNFNADTPPTPNHPATGLPTISGTTRVGETLTADTSGIEDADGLDNATFSYQWVATDGGTDLDIQGATEATYTLIPIDAALRFKVRVSFTDDGGNEETLTSEVTAVVARAE